MEQEYDVLMGGAPVGKVQVNRQGLYYRFTCRCGLSDRQVCRLYVQCGDQKENLGILVPDGDCFTLTTTLPVKKIGEGQPEFRVVPKGENRLPEKFVPIYPEEPFAYIDRLQNAFLAVHNGQPGAVFSEEAALDAYREK